MAIQTEGSALLSSCERYRYSLSRWWSPPTGPWCLWVMLNPSTADDRDDDRTIETIVRLTWSWANPGLIPAALATPRFCGLHVANLYAWRARDPMELLGEQDVIGPQNDKLLAQMAADADMIVAAWGNGPFPVRRRTEHLLRISRVLELLGGARKPIHALEMTRQGHPRHPLYSRSGAIPFVWKAPQE